MGSELFFAIVDDRLLEVEYYVALISINKFSAGQRDETDVILYRYCHRCSLCPRGKYEMVRFHPADKEIARKYFPYGPPYDYTTSAWKETDDWLANVARMTLPLRNAYSARIDNYPRNFLPPHFSLPTSALR